MEVTYHPAADLAAGGAVLAELAQHIIDLVGPERPGQPGRWAAGWCRAALKPGTLVCGSINSTAAFTLPTCMQQDYLLPFLCHLQWLWAWVPCCLGGGCLA